jgi:hypothetical protein
LFDFLAAQARHPAPAVWARHAQGEGRAEDAGYYALLLSNLVEQAAPQQSATLYSVALSILDQRLTVAGYGQWLRSRAVDAPRLAAHLDHALATARCSNRLRRRGCQAHSSEPGHDSNSHKPRASLPRCHRLHEP